jgi:hypothetical protein
MARGCLDLLWRLSCLHLLDLLVVIRAGLPSRSFGASSPPSVGFRLPPIPYAETIPWLTGSAPKTPSSLGLLLSPQPLTTTPSDFAAAPVPNRALLSRQIVGDAAVSTE